MIKNYCALNKPKLLSIAVFLIQICLYPKVYIQKGTYTVQSLTHKFSDIANYKCRF